MKYNKGFTLIEMLIVIAIVGIISSVTVISLARAKEKAIESKILNELKQKQKVAFLCLADGKELVCGNFGDCNPDNSVHDDPGANYVPYGHKNICYLQSNSTTWGRYIDDYDWEWYRGVSNVEEQSFCFGLKKVGENKYISCSSDSCHVTNSLVCHLPCRANGLACSTHNNCCSGYCDSGTCNNPPIIGT